MTRFDLTKRIFDNVGYIKNMVIISLITGTVCAFSLAYILNGGVFSWLYFILLMLCTPSAVLFTLLLFNWFVDKLFRPLHKDMPMERWGTFYALCLLTTPIGGLIYLMLDKSGEIYEDNKDED